MKQLLFAGMFALTVSSLHSEEPDYSYSEPGLSLADSYVELAKSMHEFEKAYFESIPPEKRAQPGDPDYSRTDFYLVFSKAFLEPAPPENTMRRLMDVHPDLKELPPKMKEFVYAFALGDFDTVEELKSKIDVLLKDKHGDNILLHHAMGEKKHYNKQLRWLIANGVDIDVMNYMGDKSFIEFLVSYDHFALQTAISMRPELADKRNTSTGRTPLFHAAIHDKDGALEGRGLHDKPGTIEFFLSHGADINAKDHNGWTPLWTAILAGRYRNAILLVAYGADPNISIEMGIGSSRYAKYANVLDELLNSNRSRREDEQGENYGRTGGGVQAKVEMFAKKSLIVLLKKQKEIELLKQDNDKNKSRFVENDKSEAQVK